MTKEFGLAAAHRGFTVADLRAATLQAVDAFCDAQRARRSARQVLAAARPWPSPPVGGRSSLDLRQGDAAAGLVVALVAQGGDQSPGSRPAARRSRGGTRVSWAPWITRAAR
jgi:hypothetical protein